MATTYTVGEGDYIRPWRNVRTRSFGIELAETVEIGDPLIHSTTDAKQHLLKVAADDVSAGIVGFAAEKPPTGYKETDRFPVWLATPDAEFIGRADTVGSDAADLADLGTARALQIDATNKIWSVDTAKADADAVRVLELLNPETRKHLTADGDVKVLVVFKVVPAASVYNSTSTT